MEPGVLEPLGAPGVPAAGHYAGAYWVFYQCKKEKAMSVLEGIVDEIDYCDIMELGFTEQIVEDKIYYKQYGYEFAIVEKKLAKNIFLSWQKETRLCELRRVDKEGFIKARRILNREELTWLVEFFTDKAKTS